MYRGKAKSETNTKMGKKGICFPFIFVLFSSRTQQRVNEKREPCYLVLKDKARGKMDCVRKRKKQLKF